MIWEDSAVPAKLELWGGVECTLSRVDDDFRDQLEESGHSRRTSDLQLFADLGIRALRYPVLWERTVAKVGGAPDWSWARQRLSHVAALGIRPIVGLLHHGSGPSGTSLVDDAFPANLASYARELAHQFPWVSDYTPVNEPLTTARFSGLYGHWYPHGRDERTFLRALLNQIRGVVLAMTAIREINPQARLVQTEDLGKTHSTPRLSYQAEFENERRWLTFDLLCGRLVPGHPLWVHLRASGLDEGELLWFAEHPCPPAVMGFNHYLTSERFLDERLERYPAHTHGGNPRDRYADVEAVRVLAQGPDGPLALLREAWSRYGLPMALTEVHLSCTRDEQLRWFAEMWSAALCVRGEGADMRAVTAWSLLGAYDWSSLMTRREGCYEPGAFDVRGRRPRTTALAEMLRQLSVGRAGSHPVLTGEGWWKRSIRLSYPPVRTGDGPAVLARGPFPGRRAPSLVLVGAESWLGRAFNWVCEERGLRFRALKATDMQWGNPKAVRTALRALNAWAVVNASGQQATNCLEFELNREADRLMAIAGALGRACRPDLPLLTFSSDSVFGGRATPYVESDATHPAGARGLFEAEIEALSVELHARTLVVRLGELFGPWGPADRIQEMLAEMAAGRRVVALPRGRTSRAHVGDLTNAVLDLLIDGESGVWHVAHPEAVTELELLRLAAERAGLNVDLVESRPTIAPAYSIPPSDVMLASERGVVLPPLDTALARHVASLGYPAWDGVRGSTRLTKAEATSL